jgi:hypothetical protein
MRLKALLLSGLLVLLVACAASEPETVMVTVIHTREVEVEAPVTEIVQVTRLVEVTREVEVTRLVETIRREQVEVTVEVERIVTATPEPSPTPTATAQAAAPAYSLSATLLQTAIRMRDDLERFGGMIDIALREGVIDCTEVVNLYDKIVAASTFDVAGSSSTIQFAYEKYRTAVATFTEGARDMTQNCRDFLDSGSKGTIPFQQWGLARHDTNEAIHSLWEAIDALD